MKCKLEELYTINVTMVTYYFDACPLTYLRCILAVSETKESVLKIV